LKQLQGTGGTGARTNGHEGDHHDGRSSLYHFGTLFYGASADTKEAGNEGTGVEVHSGKTKSCHAGAVPCVRFLFYSSLLDIIILGTVATFICREEAENKSFRAYTQAQRDKCYFGVIAPSFSPVLASTNSRG
jgi:hypothetical protein